MRIYFIILGLIWISVSLFAKEKFTSSYLDFSKDCKAETSDSEGDAPLVCKSIGKYSVKVNYSACFETVLVESKDQKEVIEFSNQPIGATDKRKMEWRFFKNQPVGIIYRMDVMKPTPNENCPEQRAGKEKLEIRGLGKFSDLSKSVSGKNANEKARKILDSFVVKRLE